MMSCTKSGSNVKTSVPQEEIGIYQQQEERAEDKSEEKSIIDIDIDKGIHGLFPGEDFLESYFYTLNFWGERNYTIGKWTLNFYGNNIYKFRPPVAGDPPEIQGSYQIYDNKVMLKYKGLTYESDYYVFDDILKEDWELEYTVINDSLYYSEGLIGKGIIFGRERSQPKDGEIRTVNGHEIVIQRNDDVRLRPKSDVTVRIGPGTNFQHCVFQWYGEEWYVVTSTTEFLREGTPIEIIGHSKNMDTVNGLTDYWYYCWIIVYPDWGGGIIEPSGMKNNSAWFFGPDIGLR
jgi:hypothetical protein